VGRPDVRLGAEVVAFMSVRPDAVVTAEEAGNTILRNIRTYRSATIPNNS
jgi:hypothetical protein